MVSAQLPCSPEGLIAAHLHLCRRAANRFLRDGVDRGDLEQVAAIGLIKAARRFDLALHVPFEAYAWIAIVGELLHYVRDYECPVRIPRRLRELDGRYVRTHDRLLVSLGRQPRTAELASALAVSETTLSELRRARESAATIELDDVVTRREAHDLCLEDRRAVEQAFATLAPIERRIIAGIYILGLPHAELSRRLGISAKRVSRIHRAALAAMQRSWAW